MKRWWRYALVVAWMFVIFRFSGEVGDTSGGRSAAIVRWLQSLGVPGTFDLLSLIVRKAAHATVYAVLAVLSFHALRADFTRRGALAGAWGISALYAISDETHQLFVAERSGSWRDVLIDVGGALLGLVLASRISRRRERAAGAVPGAV